MVLRRALALAVALLCASPALAQQQYDPGGKARVTVYSPPAGTPLPVVPGGVTAIAGQQRGLAIASATALTVPAGATLAVITPQGTNNTSGVCAYWQDDGTNPTASAGNPISALAVMSYRVTGLPIKFIAATGATCTLSVAYYQ